MNKILLAIALPVGLLWGQAPLTPPSQNPQSAAPNVATAVSQETIQSSSTQAATHQRAVISVLDATGGKEPAPSQEAASTLHLVVGRSLFIDTANRMRRVYVSNPSVLDALAATPHQLVISAKAPGTSSLVVWNESGESTLYTVLADIDIGNLRVAFANAFPADRIDVKAVQGKIYLSGVVGSNEAADQAAKLAVVYSKDVVSALTIDPRHPPQVRLQVRFAELDRTKMEEFGFNFLSHRQERRRYDHPAIYRAQRVAGRWGPGYHRAYLGPAQSVLLQQRSQSRRNDKRLATERAFCKSWPNRR